MTVDRLQAIPIIINLNNTPRSPGVSDGGFFCLISISRGFYSKLNERQLKIGPVGYNFVSELHSIALVEYLCWKLRNGVEYVLCCPFKGFSSYFVG